MTLTLSIHARTYSIALWKMAAAGAIPYAKRLKTNSPFGVLIPENFLLSSATSICRYTVLKSIFVNLFLPAIVASILSMVSKEYESTFKCGFTVTLKSPQMQQTHHSFVLELSGLPNLIIRWEIKDTA